jgi:hypothetical protein
MPANALWWNNCYVLDPKTPSPPRDGNDRPSPPSRLAGGVQLDNGVEGTAI